MGGARARRALRPLWPPYLSLSLLGPGPAPRDPAPGPGNSPPACSRASAFYRSRLGAGPAPPRAGASFPGPPRPAGFRLPGWAPLRRPVWGDAGPFFLFLGMSRASASKVKSEHSPKSR